MVDYVTPGVMPVGVHRRETPEMKKRSSYKLPPLWKPLPKSMAEISDKAKGASTSNVCSAVITPDCLFRECAEAQAGQTPNTYGKLTKTQKCIISLRLQAHRRETRWESLRILVITTRKGT